RRSPLLVQCSNLAVDSEAFSLQRFEGIDEDWIIVVEALPVARNQVDLVPNFESECPVAVELHFLEPIASREIVDFHRLHRLNERKVGRGFYHRSIMEQACLCFESSNPGSSCFVLLSRDPHRVRASRCSSGLLATCRPRG